MLPPAFVYAKYNIIQYILIPQYNYALSPNMSISNELLLSKQGKIVRGHLLYANIRELEYHHRRPKTSSTQMLLRIVRTVSYTHLTLPTNREV